MEKMCYALCMQIVVQNPYLSTWIFTILLIAAAIFSIRKKKDDGLLTLSVTQELKGFAILAVVFSHIGYFLVTDNHFLYPLSTIAGVGVNLFLFLSGFGLIMSSLTKNISIFEFYKKHLSKIYIPLWISLAIFFVLSFFIAHTGYSMPYILRSFAGIFTSADLFKDINSPLWFITFIVFYYLLFPIIFSKKYPWISAIILYLLTYIIIWNNPAIIQNVIYLYNVHIIAFPLGMCLAYILSRSKITAYLKKITATMNTPLYLVLICGLLFGIGYTAYFSGVGQSVFLESSISMITVFLLILLFIIKKVRIELLYLLGLYSFEIYLIHWPIMYHYDLFYQYLPPWLATISYLGLFLILGFILQKISKRTKLVSFRF